MGDKGNGDMENKTAAAEEGDGKGDDILRTNNKHNVHSRDCYLYAMCIDRLSKDIS